MNDFKGRHFGGEIVLWAVRWYCRYPISYRDLEAMMTERGVAVDHSTIYRWVQRFAPEMEKRLRWQWRRPRSRSWRIDETYVRVRGQWAYLYRALDKFGNTLDFYLSSTRNTKAAKRFLGKALNGLKDWELPEVTSLEVVHAPTPHPIQRREFTNPDELCNRARQARLEHRHPAGLRRRARTPRCGARRCAP